MKDIETKSIFETYSKHKQRLGKLAYLRENFEDGGNPFGKDSDDKADDDTEDTENVSTDDKDTDSSDTSKDSKSSDTSSSSSTSTSSSSSSKTKDDGKMTEEELDEEIDHLTSKKDKIKKLFEDESIDKEVAEQALDKIKQLTNQLISKFI